MDLGCKYELASRRPPPAYRGLAVGLSARRDRRDPRLPCPPLIANPAD